MTKLFVPTGIFHPESGGPATYLYHILPHLQEQGFEVQLLTYGDADTTDYPYPVERIPREQFPARQWNYARAARPLTEWADVTYVNTLALPQRQPKEKPRILKIVGDQAWERSIRNGWILPDADIDQFQFMRYRNPLVRWAKRFRRREITRATAVIVPSIYLGRMVMQWGVPSIRTHVIYNALPPRETPATQSQADARAQLNLHPDTPTLLTVARLVRWKGVDLLIEALAAVPDVHLLVAGDGPMRSELEQLAQTEQLADRIHFLGQVAREQIPVYMRAADYVALYSGYEGLSHVLLESLREGTPLIASRKGGNPEIVRSEQNGLLVDYPNKDALIAAIETAFQPGKRAALAANTADGTEKFDYDRMVLETAGVLKKYL